MRSDIKIVALPKDKWKGTPIPLVTKSNCYYDFEIDPLDREGCMVRIVRKSSEQEIIHTPDEYDFPDSLYQDHWEKAEAYGVYLHQGFELIGFDTCCYTNNDIGRREVRINLGFFFHREGRRN